MHASAHLPRKILHALREDRAKKRAGASRPEEKEEI
jgi:hypothetical protein